MRKFELSKLIVIQCVILWSFLGPANAEQAANLKKDLWPCVEEYEKGREITDCIIESYAFQNDKFIITLDIEGKRLKYQLRSLPKPKQNQYHKVWQYKFCRLAIKALKYAKVHRRACSFITHKNRSKSVAVLEVKDPASGSTYVLLCEAIGRKISSGLTCVQIVGERCSGTKFLEELVDLNLIMPAGVAWPLGWKHRPVLNWEDHSSIKSPSEILVLATARNALDWIKSMYQKQYHLVGMSHLSFNEFIQTQWTSCKEDVRPNGQLFENIFQLRKERNKEFFDLQKTYKNFYFINYEVILKYPAEIMADIASKFGLRTCSIFVNIEKFSRRGKRIPFRGGAQSDRYLKADLDRYRDLLDQETERMLGYACDSSVNED